MKPRRFEECPHCGAQFKAGRLACPECGSDAETGWQSEDEIDYLSVDIPETYEDLVGGSPPETGRRWTTVVVVVLLVAVLAGLLQLAASVL